MPAVMRKIRGKNLYRVTDTAGHVHAKGAKQKDAAAQVRILNQAHSEKRKKATKRKK